MDGEVISRVFDDWDDAIDAMVTLQHAAVEADAEPGLNAGLHVHVAAPRNDLVRSRAFLAYLVWEPAICELATGCFPQLRGMNRSVTADIRSWLRSRGITTAPARWINEAVEQSREGNDVRAEDLYYAQYNADRHSHLSVNTRFGTWEFRVWNSTRSAWRMELAARMAVAFRCEDFVECLLNREGRRDLDALARVVAADWQNDDRLAVLIDRQVSYMPHANEAPQRFLVA